MVSAGYSRILLNYTSYGVRNSTILAAQLSFREYDFNIGCLYPLCPQDFGSLKNRSRFPPNLPGFEYGSLSKSSVYLYSSATGLAAKNDNTWDNYVYSRNGIHQVINGLTYQDEDMQVLYERGPNTTVMFYVSTQIGSSSNYMSVHRTFPGVKRNTTNYDPPNRSWFRNAPIDSYYFYGPYIETFTKQVVVTLSTKSRTTALGTSSADRITTVSAAVFLIEVSSNTTID